MRPRQLPALALLAAGACTTPPAHVGGRPADGARGLLTAFETSGGQSPNLYARDGGVVDGPEPGSTNDAEQAARVIQNPGPETKLSLLELYQQAIAERDDLTAKLEVLEATVRGLDAELTVKVQDLASGDQRFSALDSRVAALERENADLAARLVTAQIRRLEAEKTLLELQLATAPAAAQAGFGGTPGATSGGTPGGTIGAATGPVGTPGPATSSHGAH
jgi:hypothetical protein